MTQTNLTTSRRHFLTCTSGAMLGLPWLESLALAKGAKPEKPTQRMAFYYLPNGITRRGFFPGEGDRPLPKFAGQNNVWRFEGKIVPPGIHPLTFTPTLAPLNPSPSTSFAPALRASTAAPPPVVSIATSSTPWSTPRSPRVARGSVSGSTATSIPTTTRLSLVIAFASPVAFERAARPPKTLCPVFGSTTRHVHAQRAAGTLSWRGVRLSAAVHTLSQGGLLDARVDVVI